MPDVLAFFHAMQLRESLNVARQGFRLADGQRLNDGELFGLAGAAAEGGGFVFVTHLIHQGEIHV